MAEHVGDNQLQQPKPSKVPNSNPNAITSAAKKAQQEDATCERRKKAIMGCRNRRQAEFTHLATARIFIT
jgi:hypothetical protein